MLSNYCVQRMGQQINGILKDNDSTPFSAHPGLSLDANDDNKRGNGIYYRFCCSKEFIIHFFGYLIDPIN